MRNRHATSHSTGLALYFNMTLLGHLPRCELQRHKIKLKKINSPKVAQGLSSTSPHQTGKEQTDICPLGCPAASKPAMLLIPVTLTCLGEHRSQQLADYRAPLPHFALFAVGEIRDDPNDVPGTGSLQCIRHYQQLHDSSIHISRRFENHSKY